MTSKASEAAPQANSSPPETVRLPWTDVTPSDLLKDLRSDLKGDNEQLRKIMDSIRREMSRKLDILTEEVQELNGWRWRFAWRGWRDGQLRFLKL